MLLAKPIESFADNPQIVFVASMFDCINYPHEIIDTYTSQGAILVQLLCISCPNATEHTRNTSATASRIQQEYLTRPYSSSISYSSSSISSSSTSSNIYSTHTRGFPVSNFWPIENISLCNCPYCGKDLSDTAHMEECDNCYSHIVLKDIVSKFIPTNNNPST